MGLTENVRASLRRDGLRGTAGTIARRGVERLGAARAWDEPRLPLRDEHVHVGPPPPPIPGRQKESLEVGWVCTPPGAGSGGHTTLFRMVRAMAERGHRCTLVLYDATDDDVARREETIRRWWPGLPAGVASVADGLDRYDAVVASSWQTAHVVASLHGGAVPFYFVQDYEAYFYPRGYLYDLAEATYTMGLQTIALGGMVAAAMRREAGAEPDLVVPFGCDVETYRLLPGRQETRRGVVYYAKRNVDRRGYLLARRTLELFHERCPDEPIHVVGDRIPGWRVPAVQHGSLPPQELNRLYNEVVAGLAMSFTNISLVAAEMLAAGSVTVLNDDPGPRLDLEHPEATWVPGRPEALADALAAAVAVSDPADRADRAARIAARRPRGWDVAQRMTAEMVEDRVRTGTGRYPSAAERSVRAIRQDAPAAP
ncbi:glycosyltransferase family 1 protein [Georgenia sp. Z1344]|uniref:rhamnosyltransferase WsaF family glycosyltransferase n=1 Tax=Georgenia sp. Z1344 TaxID=3416706 RepID=UPI003CF29B5B